MLFPKGHWPTRDSFDLNIFESSLKKKTFKTNQSSGHHFYFKAFPEKESGLF